MASLTGRFPSDTCRGPTDTGGLPHAARSSLTTIGVPAPVARPVSCFFTRGRKGSIGGRLRLQGRRVPDPGRVVDAAGDEAMAVGAEGHAVDAGGVIPERQDLLPGL